MSESIRRHLESLSLRELSERRESLSSILSLEGINFSREGRNDIINFTFESSGSNSGIIFSAHYDNYRNSYGANDNMAAVCILIDIYHFLSAEGVHADFVLTDGEEDNHSGAELFAQSHDLKKYSCIVNLDLCGYGDVIVIRGRGIKRFTGPEVLRRNNAEIVKYLPDSDDVIFRKYNPKSLSISIVPKWDLQYLKALASFGEGLLGRPPEFYMILSQMEITQTIHNNSKDNPEFVYESSMIKVYDYLLDAMTLNEADTKFSFMNFFRRRR